MRIREKHKQTKRDTYVSSGVPHSQKTNKRDVQLSDLVSRTWRSVCLLSVSQETCSTSSEMDSIGLGTLSSPLIKVHLNTYLWSDLQFTAEEKEFTSFIELKVIPHSKNNQHLCMKMSTFTWSHLADTKDCCISRRQLHWFILSVQCIHLYSTTVLKVTLWQSACYISNMLTLKGTVCHVLCGRSVSVDAKCSDKFLCAAILTEKEFSCSLSHSGNAYMYQDALHVSFILTAFTPTTSLCVCHMTVLEEQIFHSQYSRSEDLWLQLTTFTIGTAWTST